MKRNVIGLIWLGGLAFALLLNAIGPDRFLAAVSDAFSRLVDDIDTLVRVLSMLSLDFVRSSAIAIFMVFLILALMAARQGIRARRAFIVVSGLFVILVYTAHPGANGHWAAALILVVVGALTMTRRLQKNIISARVC